MFGHITLSLICSTENVPLKTENLFSDRCNANFIYCHNGFFSSLYSHETKKMLCIRNFTRNKMLPILKSVTKKMHIHFGWSLTDYWLPVMCRTIHGQYDYSCVLPSMLFFFAGFSTQNSRTEKIVALTQPRMSQNSCSARNRSCQCMGDMENTTQQQMCWAHFGNARCGNDDRVKRGGKCSLLFKYSKYRKEFVGWEDGKLRRKQTKEGSEKKSWRKMDLQLN